MSAGRGGARGLILALVLCGVGAALARSQLGGPLVLGSGAMAPALRAGEVVWVDRSGAAAARPGAVVAYRQPAGGALTVKRVVGIAGETVEIAGGVLHLDGRPQGGVGEERWCGHAVAVHPGADAPATAVPAGAAYVLGDDRRASSDSRQWGAIPVDNVVGRVQFVLWGDGGPRGSVGCDGGRALTD